MRDSGLVQFGSHSRRHTRLLPELTAVQLDDELRGSRSRLEQMIGRPVDIFCYPNGDCSPAALALARTVYRAAVTTVPGWNQPHSDLHLLRRLSVHEDITADRGELPGPRCRPALVVAMCPSPSSSRYRARWAAAQVSMRYSAGSRL